MNNLAARIVGFAADQLPEPERARRLEEWNADLDGAAEHGVSRMGIALGAIALALGSPLPSPVAAGWWAQWALAVSAVGPVVWLSLWTSGLFLSDPAIRDSIEPIVVASTIVALILLLVAGVRGRGVPWVGSGAIILLCLTGALWVVGVSWPTVLMPMLGLAVVGLVVIGWRLRHISTTTPRHAMAVLASVALPLLVVVISVTGPMDNWAPIAAAFVAALIALIAAARSPRSVAGTARPRKPVGLIVLATMSVCIIAVAALVTHLIVLAAGTTDAWTSRQWTRLAPSVTLQIGATVVAVATLLSLGAIVVAVARHRQSPARVNGLTFLLAAAIASVGTRVPYLGPLGAATDPIVTVIGLGGCVAAVVGVVLLIAPPVTRSEKLVEVPVD
ncbi:MAG: hypothetical protein ABJB03_13010 [Rhodoglobus sp.]